MAAGAHQMRTDRLSLLARTFVQSGTNERTISSAMLQAISMVP